MLQMDRINKKEVLTLPITDDYSSPKNPLELLSVFWKEVNSGNPQQFEWIARRPNDGSTFLAQVNLKKNVFGNLKFPAN